MNKIYDLYEALLTIKCYCISNEKNARIAYSLIMLIAVFFKDTAPSNWKLVEST